MLTQSVRALLIRDLATLAREVERYPDEQQLWARPPGLPNSAGVLVRHLCGNLQHFVGAQLGATGYRRDREAEFGAPPCSRADLLAEIATTRAAVAAVLERLPAEVLAREYPLALTGRSLGTGDFLIHLAVHCAFHLGQVDYHRRVVTGSSESAAPMAIPELASARPAEPAGA